MPNKMLTTQELAERFHKSDLTYKKVAEVTGIPKATVHRYMTQKCKIPLEKAPAIEKRLVKDEDDAVLDLLHKAMETIASKMAEITDYNGLTECCKALMEMAQFVTRLELEK